MQVLLWIGIVLLIVGLIMMLYRKGVTFKVPDIQRFGGIGVWAGGQMREVTKYEPVPKVNGPGKWVAAVGVALTLVGLLMRLLKG